MAGSGFHMPGLLPSDWILLHEIISGDGNLHCHSRDAANAESI